LRGRQCNLDQLQESMDFLIDHFERHFHKHRSNKPFIECITTGWYTMDKYYNKINESGAYAAATLLHPNKRKAYLRAAWRPKWIKSGLRHVKTVTRAVEVWGACIRFSHHRLSRSRVCQDRLCHTGTAGMLMEQRFCYVVCTGYGLLCGMRTIGKLDLAHDKVAFIGRRYGALLRCIFRLFFGRSHTETYAAFHSRCEKSLVECRLAWWLIAVMIAVEAFLHYTSGVGYGSATSTSNFGMADVIVSSYFLFAFRHDGAMRATETNVQF